MSSCPLCGTPTAPSWVFCPKCAAQLDGPVDQSPLVLGTDVLRPKQAPPPPRKKPWASSRLRRVVGIASVLVLAWVIVLISTNEVGVHDQLRSTRSALSSAKTRLYYSQASLRIVNTRLQHLQSQSASTESSLGTTQNALDDALQGAVDTRQGVPGTTGTIIIDLPRVKGVGGAVILTPTTTAGSSAVSLIAVINGGVNGGRYYIAAGECPENLATPTLTVGGLAVGGPTTNIDLPNMGTHFWFRLHRATPPADALSGVLGGVLGPFSQAGTGTPVPPNKPAC